MKHIQTPSQTFMAVRFETTGNVDRKPFEVVKKLSIVVTPKSCNVNGKLLLQPKLLPIITRAGTAFHSNQKVMKDDVTKMIPGMKTVVK